MKRAKLARGCCRPGGGGPGMALRSTVRQRLAGLSGRYSLSGSGNRQSSSVDLNSRKERMPAKRRAAVPSRSRSRAGLGALPLWNLADLYDGMHDPRIERDLARADAECLAFEQAYKGNLAALASGPQAGTALAGAVRRYE